MPFTDLDELKKEMGFNLEQRRYLEESELFKRYKEKLQSNKKYKIHTRTSKQLARRRELWKQRYKTDSKFKT